MAADKLDYASVIISDIDAKIAALQALREAAEKAAALGVLGPQIEGVELTMPGARNDTIGVPTDLPEGAFNGKSVPACVELYLSAVKKKKTNKEIAAALREGGVESNAKDFDTVVAGALFGLKQTGKVLRFKDGWGLAEWYPPHIRGSATAPTKKQSNKKKRQKKGASAGSASASTKASAAPSQTVEAVTITAAMAGKATEQSAQERIVNFLRSKPHSEFSGKDVARELPDIKPNIIQLILGRLTDKRRKIAERTESGNYRIVASNLHQMTAAV